MNIAATQALIDQFYKDQGKKPPVVVPNVVTIYPGEIGREDRHCQRRGRCHDRHEEAHRGAEGSQESRSELAQAQKENIDTIAGLGQQLALVGLKGKDLMQTQAELQLNEYATPEQVAQVRALAAALCTKRNRSKPTSSCWGRWTRSPAKTSATRPNWRI
ncbi:hypothetical protein [Pseudomonas aeruginosa]